MPAYKLRRITKGVSFPLDLVARVDARAAQEGHNNFSAIVVAAVQAYLAVPYVAGEEDEANKKPAA